MSEKYEYLQKKFKLPSIKEIKKEFGIELKKEDLDSIINEVTDIFSENARLLESLLFVDSGSPPARLYEASMLKENEIDIFEIYKEMMSLFWFGKRIKLNGNEKQKVEFILKSFNKWKKMRQELEKIFNLFEKEWVNVSFRQSDDVIYHG
ncbi:MAG: hypothetical protein QXJ06_02770 [Candidatus Aenigmatarchaeota archaeon]